MSKCVKCGYTSYGRSNQQNRYYHSVVVRMIADEVGYTSDDECHEDLKRKFNPKVSQIDGETYGGSTKELDTKSFEDYLEMIRAWASFFLCLSIPTPNEVDNEQH